MAKDRTAADAAAITVATAATGASVIIRLAGSIVLALGLSLALALACAAVARADVPDARNCLADTTLVGSPGGGYTFEVELRDNANQPLAGGTAVLDFNTAPGLVLCGDIDTDHDGRLVGTADALGRVTFLLKLGGQTTGRVTVGTALDVITQAWPRTTDFDADLDVDSADRSALLALLGTSGPAGDFDLNGVVDSADVAIFDSTMGQTCASTPARVASWGEVKALYR